MTALDWIVILVVPLIWTIVAVALRRCLSSANAVPDDRIEKRYLVIMVAPFVLSLLLVVVGRLAPVPVSALRVLHNLPTWLSAPARSAPAAGHATESLVLWMTIAIAALYGTGVIRMAWPLAYAIMTLRRIVAGSARVVCDGEIVHLTEALVPPLAWGRDRVVLPRALYQQLSPEKLRLIIRHEHAHLSRRDTEWFAWLSVVDVLFWFNPFLRRQTQRCRVAAEIACDNIVTRAAPDDREAYAELLVGVLKHFATDALQGVPAMSLPTKYGDFRMRLEQILRTDTRPGRPKNKVLYATLIVASLPLVFAQFAWSQAPNMTEGADSFKGLWTADMLAKQDDSRAYQEAHNPAVLHRRLAAEVRDNAWADAHEQALNAQLSQFRPVGAEAVLAIVKCKTTICEVDVKLIFKPTATGAEREDAFNQLNVLTTEKMTNGFDDAGATIFNSLPKSEFIMMNFYLRNKA